MFIRQLFLFLLLAVGTTNIFSQTATGDSKQEPYLVLHNKVNEYLKKNDYASVNALLKDKPAEARTRTWYMVASNMIMYNQDNDIVKKYAGWGYEMSKETMEHPKDEFDKKYAKYNLGKAAEIMGCALAREGKYAEALKYFDMVQNNAPLSTALQLEELYLITMANSGKYSEVKKRLEERMMAGEGSLVIKDAVKAVYKKENKNSEKGFDKYYAKLENSLKDSITVHAKKTMISEPAPGFSLTDLDGNLVSLAALKGKVVVIDFWATWCGPCKASFPGMQLAMEKYKADKDVVFLFINAWERTKDAKPGVIAFVKDNKLPFTVLFDQDDKVISSYKVKGIPNKFVIDKEGKIRFNAVGNPGGQEALVTELSAMIELAKKKA